MHPTKDILFSSLTKEYYKAILSYIERRGFSREKSKNLK
jgi:hypothetical protein